jgi:hypothetical protein
VPGIQPVWGTGTVGSLRLRVAGCGQERKDTVYTSCASPQCAVTAVSSVNAYRHTSMQARRHAGTQACRQTSMHACRQTGMQAHSRTHCSAQCAVNSVSLRTRPLCAAHTRKEVRNQCSPVLSSVRCKQCAGIAARL